MPVPHKMPPTVEKLQERIEQACDLKQTIDWDRIVDCLERWIATTKLDVSTIVRIDRAEQLYTTLSFPRSEEIATNEGKNSEILFRLRTGDPAEKGVLRWYAGDSGNGRMRNLYYEKTIRVGFKTRLVSPAYAGMGSAMFSCYDMMPDSVRQAENAARAANNPMAGWPVKATWSIALMSINVLEALKFNDDEAFWNWYPVLEAFEAGAALLFLADRTLEICTLPRLVKVDDDNQLHSENGPAFEWLDKIRIFFWHGMPLDPRTLKSPERITLADIAPEELKKFRRAKLPLVIY